MNDQLVQIIVRLTDDGTSTKRTVTNKLFSSSTTTSRRYFEVLFSIKEQNGDTHDKQKAIIKRQCIGVKGARHSKENTEKKRSFWFHAAGEPKPEAVRIQKWKTFKHVYSQHMTDLYTIEKKPRERNDKLSAVKLTPNIKWRKSKEMHETCWQETESFGVSRNKNEAWGNIKLSGYIICIQITLPTKSNNGYMIHYGEKNLTPTCT